MLGILHDLVQNTLTQQDCRRTKGALQSQNGNAKTKSAGRRRNDPVIGSSATTKVGIGQ